MMDRWTRWNVRNEAAERGAVPVRKSRTLKGADVITVVGGLLAILTGAGVFTPDEAGEVSSQVAGLADLVERASAAVLAVIAVAGQLFRYVRLKLEEL